MMRFDADGYSTRSASLGLVVVAVFGSSSGEKKDGTTDTKAGESSGEKGNQDHE